jgi:predicted phosphodiesterase
MPRKPSTQHPVVSMLNLIDNENIESDVLLCLGDLGDKADEQGIASAWGFSEEIKAKLKAEIKIGIPGNHDVNSRKNNAKDAFTYVKNFHESFPTDIENLNTKFWELGYCTYEFKDCLFLLINTVHNHDCELNANTSLIKKTTLEEIGKELKIKENYKYKICLLHHHPIKHSNISNYKDSDSIEKGDDLISLLVANRFNIVIHGHKHQPRIVEYNGLNILATGSFSSFANLQGTGLSNMFHVLNLNDNSRYGLIYSWEYNIKNGWKKNYNDLFPSKIGFGAHIDINDIAEKINDKWLRVNSPILYSEILNEFPDLEYLIPDKLKILGEILETKYNISASPPFPLKPEIITSII